MSKEPLVDFTIHDVRGRAIIAARSMLGWDQKYLAKLLKWSPAKLSAKENGAQITVEEWTIFRNLFAKNMVALSINQTDQTFDLKFVFRTIIKYYNDEPINLG